MDISFCGEGMEIFWNYTLVIPSGTKILSMLIVLGFGVIVHQVLLFGCSFRAPIPTCQQLRWLK